MDPTEINQKNFFSFNINTNCETYAAQDLHKYANRAAAALNKHVDNRLIGHYGHLLVQDDTTPLDL